MTALVNEPLRDEGAALSSRSAPALFVAAFAALLASTCCLMPLAFVLVGISGAWIARLTVLQPYSLPLEAVAALCLAVAGWRIYRPATCRLATRATRAGFWTIVVLTLLPLLVAGLAPWLY